MKIFIFRIYYKDKIMGQAIHRKAKGCLVRFADVMNHQLWTYIDNIQLYMSHNNFFQSQQLMDEFTKNSSSQQIFLQ